METVAAAPSLNITSIGVLDGHGPQGHFAARTVASHFAAAIHSCAPQSLVNPESSLWWDYDEYSDCPRASNLRHPAALALEGQLADFTHDSAQACLEQTFSHAATSVQASPDFFIKSGCTAVLALILPGRWVGSFLHQLAASQRMPAAVGTWLCIDGVSERREGRRERKNGCFGGGTGSTSACCACCGCCLGRAALLHRLLLACLPPFAIMLLPPYRSVVAAWVGDSRAVVGTAEGNSYAAAQLTRDHTPQKLSELTRIVAAGGLVSRPATDSKGRPIGEPCWGGGGERGFEWGEGLLWCGVWGEKIDGTPARGLGAASVASSSFQAQLC